jgi:glycosyltransferase involved in cell wall biosynthesis
MSRFSLIVATFDRTNELRVLLKSFAKQELGDFEVIVVDQNSDDRVVQLLKEFTAEAKTQETGHHLFNQVKYIRSAPGASRARNQGLAHASGEILAFPDDDCWYPADTLKKVDEWFRQRQEYGILSIGCRDEAGRISSNRWWQAECDIKWINIFRTSGGCCFFVRRPTGAVPVLFDESLGPGAGTRFGCGEDTDYLLTLMSHGIRGRFYSAWHVGHPCRDGFVDVQRAERYGGGFGRVLRKHSNPYLFAGLVTFDFARAALRMLLGDREQAARFWAHGRGMISAYLSQGELMGNYRERLISHRHR